MKHFISYIIICVMLLGCATKEDDLSPRPEGTPTVPEVEEIDYSFILSDNSIRLESDTLKINYESGGVLYSADGTRHRFIDLRGGKSAVFDSSVPSLMLNGSPVKVEKCISIGEKESLRWYVIQPGGHIVVVEE